MSPVPKENYRQASGSPSSPVLTKTLQTTKLESLVKNH